MKTSRSILPNDCPQIGSSNAALPNMSAARDISLASPSETIVPPAIYAERDLGVSSAKSQRVCPRRLNHQIQPKQRRLRRVSPTAELPARQ